ncbi:DUF6578 domain-containing protein [Kineosporia succinea]|uniref:Uncharacterized protein n=1 Tax=Kineosporia succinea TaxID=84632 RepID=A0ABT9PBI0_9ACTN|nr:DUF6578 domain-containing protein [Kineosporia succinea]MDP9829876.1 hypothetical protein [Kineosporia succinea]
MRTYVWMSGWQLECCGSSFGVGESVQWPVGLEEPSGTEELLEVLDGDWARRVQYREDHHQVWASGVLTGTVASIDGVTCSTKLVEEIAKVRVPGSGRVLGVPDLEAAYPVASDQRTLVGWVIGVEGASYEAFPPPALEPAPRPGSLMRTLALASRKVLGRSG